MSAEFLDITHRTNGTHKTSNEAGSKTDLLGRGLEIFAHALSLSRAVGGIAIAKEVVSKPDYQSWKLAGKFALLTVTDWLDGKLARSGRQRQHKDESENRVLNAFIDQIPDKIMIDSTEMAIGTREMLNGNTIYGATVIGTAGVTIVRDVYCTADRIKAAKQNIDTRAQSAGKRKALGQNLVTFTSLTPITRSRFGRSLVGAAFALTAHESVTSGISMHKDFESGRRERTDQFKSIETKMELACTSQAPFSEVPPVHLQLEDLLEPRHAEQHSLN